MAQNEYIKCMEYSFQSKYMKISNVKYRILSRRIWNTSCQLYIPLRHRSSRIHSTTREDQAWDPLHCKVPATLRFGAVVLCTCLGRWLMTGEVRMRTDLSVFITVLAEDVAVAALVDLHLAVHEEAAQRAVVVCGQLLYQPWPVHLLVGAGIINQKVW